MKTEAALRCITPDLRQSYKAALMTTAKIFGIEPETLIPALAGIPCPLADKEMRYEILDVDMTDDAHAVVTIRVHFYKEYSEEVSIHCLRYGKNWYISE